MNLTALNAAGSCIKERICVTKSNYEWFIYLLECKGGKIYCGITTDIEKRFKAHVSGKGAKFTRANPPLRMIAAKPCCSRSDASKSELAIKQLTPSQKIATAAEWVALEKPKG
jgi:putative endonuclease